MSSKSQGAHILLSIDNASGQRLGSPVLGSTDCISMGPPGKLEIIYHLYCYPVCEASCLVVHTVFAVSEPRVGKM